MKADAVSGPAESAADVEQAVESDESEATGEGEAEQWALQCALQDQNMEGRKKMAELLKKQVSHSSGSQQ